jgi:hypothetical protein
MNRSDPSILLIYDDAGFIAGIQFAFFKKLVNEKYYPFSSSIAYQVQIFTCCAGVFKQSVEARNRIGTGLSYRHARAGIFKQSMEAGNRGGIGLLSVVGKSRPST